jgi:holo-[acyl-carrier protein] synthase
MILGIGVDMVQVSRIEHWLEQPGLSERFFHPEELRQLKAPFKQRSQSLAARFAAKEAFAKALGTGLRGIVLKDIRVESNHEGKPAIFCEGTAAAACVARGAAAIHVSLSHERDFAVAVVVIEAKDA